MENHKLAELEIETFTVKQESSWWILFWHSGLHFRICRGAEIHCK